MNRIDWAGLMRIGLGGLGLAPEVFWRLTPVELRTMLGTEQEAPALTRARFEELAAAFPDARPDLNGEQDDGYWQSDRPDSGTGDDA